MGGGSGAEAGVGEGKTLEGPAAMHPPIAIASGLPLPCQTPPPMRVDPCTRAWGGGARAGRSLTRSGRTTDSYSVDGARPPWHGGSTYARTASTDWSNFGREM